MYHLLILAGRRRPGTRCRPGTRRRVRARDRAGRERGCPEDGYIAYGTGYANDGLFNGEFPPMQADSESPNKNNCDLLSEPTQKENCGCERDEHRSFWSSAKHPG